MESRDCPTGAVMFPASDHFPLGRAYGGLDATPAPPSAFVADVGRAVYKPFGGSGVDDDDGFRQVFCTVIDLDQCGDPNISRTMHLFQQ